MTKTELDSITSVSRSEALLILGHGSPFKRHERACGSGIQLNRYLRIVRYLSNVRYPATCQDIAKHLDSFQDNSKKYITVTDVAGARNWAIRRGVNRIQLEKTKGQSSASWVLR